jgi:hypothetical protein
MHSRRNGEPEREIEREEERGYLERSAGTLDCLHGDLQVTGVDSMSSHGHEQCVKTEEEEEEGRRRSE